MLIITQAGRQEEMLPIYVSRKQTSEPNQHSGFLRERGIIENTQHLMKSFQGLKTATA